MIVCVCNAISDSEIKEWVALGGESLEQLESDLGLGTCCGKCRDCAHELVSTEVSMTAVQLSRS